MLEAVSEGARLSLRQALLLLLEVPHAATKAQQAGQNHASNCKEYADQDYPILQTMLLSVSPCTWPRIGMIAPGHLSRLLKKDQKARKGCSLSC